MITAEKIISDQFPYALDSDPVSSALGLMRSTHCSQLPLLSEDEYLGLIREEDLLNVEDEEKPINEIGLPRLKAAVTSDAHLYDVVKLLTGFHLQVLPVLDTEGAYTGAILRDTLIDFFAEHEAINAAGGIIVLAINPNNYSLSEIARICESNQVTILKSSIFNNPESGMTEVTLKVNTTELQYVLATFERYEYMVMHVFGDSTASDHLSNRFDLLMNYINM
jgi:acetoin utilization protein AcuB